MTKRTGWRGLVVAVGVATVLTMASGGAHADVPAAAYLALGDSYTAGPFVPPSAGGPPGCLRSGHDYPHLVAAALGVQVDDVSCAGATTADLAGSQALPGEDNPPQLDAVGPATRLVTLGIGGNDIGFSEIVLSCVVVLPIGEPCRDRYVSPSGDEIGGRIAAAAPRIASVVAAIHERAPAARVYVVGYPAILPTAGPGCWPVMPFAPDDVPWLRAKEVELNAMLATEAASGGAAYVDTYTPSLGHDTCSAPGVRWVEPVIPLAPAAPVHPDARGMEGMAGVVAGVVAGALAGAVAGPGF